MTFRTLAIGICRAQWKMSYAFQTIEKKTIERRRNGNELSLEMLALVGHGTRHSIYSIKVECVIWNWNVISTNAYMRACVRLHCFFFISERQKAKIKIADRKTVFNHEIHLSVGWLGQ